MLSKKLINKNFQILSKCSYEFINSQNKLYIKRERETNLVDAFAFKMMYTQKETGQVLVTNKLNKFKNTSIERSCYVDRIKLIDEHLLTSYYSFLDNKINELFYKTNNTSYQICAVDGTKTNAYSSTKNQSFKSTKKQDIFTFLNIGFFNVSHNDPQLLRSIEHKNERKAFYDNISTNSAQTIYVTDKGFMDYNMFSEINKSNNYFVCRIRDNSLIINKTVNEQIIHNYKNISFLRVINYKINDKYYHIITNIPSSMYTCDEIKNIYHKRWSIEEYFKYIKNNMKMDKFTERDWNSIKISVYMNFIISKLVYLITNLYTTKIKNKNRTINKTLLTQELYGDFLLKFIYNIKFSERMLIKFFNFAINIIVTHLGVSNERKSMFPHTKFYVKSYQKKNKKV